MSPSPQSGSQMTTTSVQIATKNQEYTSQELQRLAQSEFESNVKRFVQVTGLTESELRAAFGDLKSQINRPVMVQKGNYPIRVVLNPHYASIPTQVSQASRQGGISVPSELSTLRPVDGAQPYQGPLAAIPNVGFGEIFDGEFFATQLATRTQNGQRPLSAEWLATIVMTTPEAVPTGAKLIPAGSRLGHSNRVLAIDGTDLESSWIEDLDGVDVRIPTCATPFGSK